MDCRNRLKLSCNFGHFSDIIHAIPHLKSPEMKAKPDSFPLTVKAGSTAVKIYRTRSLRAITSGWSITLAAASAAQLP